MSDIDNKNVINCWGKIKSTKGTDYFVDTFYRVLFEHHPDVRPLFPDDLKIQKSSLLSMLISVVSGAEFTDIINKDLLDLGEFHKSLGVRKEMFGYFIKSIIEAANISSDFSLTKDELVAWESAFRKTSNIMLKAY